MSTKKYDDSLTHLYHVELHSLIMADWATYKLSLMVDTNFVFMAKHQTTCLSCACYSNNIFAERQHLCFASRN